jgi:hypothetical protein
MWTEETACVEKPFRKIDCEEEQKNVAITGEVCEVKGELTNIILEGGRLQNSFETDGTVSAKWEIMRKSEERSPLKVIKEWPPKQKQRLTGFYFMKLRL